MTCSSGSTRIFADGADLDTIRELADDPRIEGFTTNPSLMWKAGLSDYEQFARRVLDAIGPKPVSFEAFADDPEELRRQALKIAGWGESVFVKIPVTYCDGRSTAPLVRELSQSGVRVNVTAVFTSGQVERLAAAVSGGAPSFVSVFAGRIADAGIDPVPIVSRSVGIVESVAPDCEVIWASPREVLNVAQARRVGCHAITLTPDLLARLPLLGKDLDLFSLETVRMFRRDAIASGFQL